MGEYDWEKHAQQRGWIWETATTRGVSNAEHLKTSSSVFDFTSQFSLKSINAGNYTSRTAPATGSGWWATPPTACHWKNRSVTFLENHDTGYRTNDDGTPQQDHISDSFANNWQVEQAYDVQILTHPGVPCVYWKHYFDWGSDLQNKIKALINARKVAGIHAGSKVDFQENAKSSGVYAARVTGRNGELYVRIGGERPTMAAERIWIQRLPGVRARGGMESMGKTSRESAHAAGTPIIRRFRFRSTGQPTKSNRPRSNSSERAKAQERRR